MLAAAVLERFKDFEDPRISERGVYPAWFLILVIMMATLAGNNTIGDLSCWANYHEELLPALSGGRWGAPSHNVLWNFILCLKPAAMKSLLQGWFQALPQELISKNSRDARHKSAQVMYLSQRLLQGDGIALLP